MKKLIVVLVLALVAVVPQAWADFERPQPKNKAFQALGSSLGYAGSGVMFRQYWRNMYVQGSGYAIYNQDEGNKYANFALSTASYLHYMDLSDYFYPIALKVLASMDWEIGKNERIDFTNVENNYLHTGVGFGLEIGNPNQPGLVVSLDLLYIASIRDGDRKAFTPDFNDLVFIEPRPAMSIFYNWK